MLNDRGPLGDPHGIGNRLANTLVGVRRNPADLRNRFRALARLGELLELFWPQ
jgi:hypothetical protein